MIVWFHLMTLISISIVTGDLVDFASLIAKQDHRVIAVFPELLEDVGHDKYRFALNSQQSIEEMERVREELERVANESFRVLKREEVIDASRGYRAADMKNEDAKRKILNQLKADVLVFGVLKTDDNAKSETNLTYWAPASPDEHVGSDAMLTHTSKHTVSDLAYAGRSFELRRWAGDLIEMTGFQEDIPDETQLVGLGAYYEQIQARYMRSDLPHPLSMTDFPFSISVRVEGETRAISRIGDEHFVTLDTGEEPEILLRNKCPHNVLVGLYIDGENTLEKIAEHPLRTPSHRHWILEPGPETTYYVRGWDYREEKLMSRFVIKHDDHSADGRTVGAPAGTITALIYTDGTPGIQIPKKIAFKGVNIEGGELEPVETRTLPGKKGLLLAAITIHYRSTAEMGQLANSQILKTDL